MRGDASKNSLLMSVLGLNLLCFSSNHEEQNFDSKDRSLHSVLESLLHICTIKTPVFGTLNSAISNFQA